MNNTDEYLTIDGVSLHQYGWSVTTVGTRLGVAPLRGDNGKAAYVPGELWTAKIPDGRTIGLNMFLTGADPATGEVVEDSRLRWNDSWAFLRQVFWNPDAQFTMGRRWWRTDPSTGQGAIVYAEALGQLEPGADLVPAMTGRTRATFDVPIRLAHPFFYGDARSTEPISVAETTTIVHPGDYAAFSRNLYIDLHGPLSAPRVTNTSPARSVYCGLSGTVAAGETLTLDVGNYLALSTTAAGTRNRTGEIYQSAYRPWLALQRGANSLTLTGGGTGYARVRWRPPYL
jgi:hypothetical protein